METAPLDGAPAELALPDQARRLLMVTYADGDGAQAVRGLTIAVDQSLSGRVLGSGESMISRPEVADRVTRAVDAMDATIKEIRGAIFALQARDARVGRP